MPARYISRHFYLSPHSLKTAHCTTEQSFLLLHVNTFIMNNIKTRLVRVAMSVPVITIAIISFAFTNYKDHRRGDGDEKLRMNEIKARAARDFSDRYPGIDNERWYRFKTGFSAKYSQNQVLNNVYYDRMGFYITTIRYYKEKNIPADLKKFIIDNFAGYTIISATEVITPKESAFHFNIKNKMRLKTVKISDTEFEVTGDYRNGDLDL
jgi:hypothetical protein